MTRENYRLYSKWDATADGQYKNNRNTTARECKKLPPPNADEQCDEFPFAATWEGSGAGNGNYSLKYVPGTDNSKAGAALAAFYKAQRVLHTDAFQVRIT